jgi:hypothetical protein
MGSMDMKKAQSDIMQSIKTYERMYLCKPNRLIFNPKDYWAFDKIRPTLNNLSIKASAATNGPAPGYFRLFAERIPGEWASFDFNDMRLIE